MRLIVFAAVVGAAGGCSFDRSGLGAGSGSIDASGSNAIDASTIDATLEFDAPNPPDATCTPTCAGMMLDECGTMTPCDLGCSTTGGAHCEALVPSNGATDADDLTGVTGAIDVPSNIVYIVDTDSGAISSSPINDLKNWTPVRGAGTGVVDGISYRVENGLAVFGEDTLTIGGGGWMRPFGTHAVIFLSRGNVTIAGFVDLSGGCTDLLGNFDRTCPGPGGGNGGAIASAGGGCAGGGASVHATGAPDSGAGGGGFGKNGGDGGDGDGAHKGGAGGASSGCAGASLVPLMGGGGGGGGGAGTTTAMGVGGGGGGGMQITSLTGSIALATAGGSPFAATIDAGGRGGAQTGGTGGGGGGAGGGILLEARAITMMNANLTANGGGGGSGRNAGNAGIGGKGSPTSSNPAMGGADDNTGHGHGGNGGAAMDATKGDGPTDGGGGGGGAVGRIRLNVPMPALTITGGVISPAQTRGDLTTR